MKRIAKGDLATPFSSRDVWRPGWSKLSDSKTVNRALELLVDYQWLFEEAREGGGMKYLERLKSEKRAVEALPKLPKAPFDSKDSARTRHFQKNAPALIPVELLPDWQQSLCEAHGDFNNWRGQCPVSLEECIISKVIESGDNLDQLRGIDLGHGITTDMVINEWLRSNEPAAALLTKPAWLVCMADHLRRRTNGDQNPET